MGPGDILTPIKDHSNLHRTSEGAVINTDRKAYLTALRRKGVIDRMKRNEEEIFDLKEKVDGMDNKLNTILELLQKDK